MTTYADEMRRMDRRLELEAVAGLQREYQDRLRQQIEEQVNGTHLLTVCDDASVAAYTARLRRRLQREEMHASAHIECEHGLFRAGFCFDCNPAA